MNGEHVVGAPDSVTVPLRCDAPAGLAVRESAVVFGEAGSELVGVISHPADAAQTKPIGVVIVVGGPQTRAGSHRQFVLLARALAAVGYSCIRFDYAGMGDSPGPMPDFERAGPDIGRAIDKLLSAVPECRRIALWGLCDGASAALLHAPGDARIAAVIAANPWARSEATRSAALVSAHYGSRLRSRDFWAKLLSGRIRVLASVSEALAHLWRARRSNGQGAGPIDATLPARLARALLAPRSAVRLQLSGKDLTAAEFEIAMQAAQVFERSPATVLRLAQADHTFSEPQAWQTVIHDTKQVLGQLEG